MKEHNSLLSAMIATGILVLLCLTACHKEEPPAPVTPQPVDYTVLPPVSFLGLNTFGCKINGEIWVPRIERKDVYSPDKVAWFHEKDGTGNGSIQANLFTADGHGDWFDLSFGPTFFRTGEYHYPECNLIYWPSPGGLYVFANTDSISNRMTISVIDTARNIISGQFEFLMINHQYPYDTLKIEDGRFDLIYIPK